MHHLPTVGAFLGLVRNLIPATGLAALLLAGGASAAPFNLFLETVDAATPPLEVTHVGYSSIGDVQTDSNASLSPTVFDVGALFDIAGVAHDGSSYHVFLESQTNEIGGMEIFHVEFTSLDGFVNGGILTSPQRGFRQFDVGAAFDLVGVANDGESYHVFLESNENRSASEEVFHLRFDTLEDLLDGDVLSANPRGFTVFDVGEAFDIAGVYRDGSSFRVLLEHQEDRETGSEVFHIEFRTLDDFVTGGILTSPDRGSTQINVNADDDIVGFAAAVPEPGSSLFLVGGMLGFGPLGRRRTSA